MPLSRMLATLIAVCLIWLCAAPSARAQSCSVTAQDIHFGVVDVLGTTPTEGVGGIVITCPTLIDILSSITITIHLGEGSGGLSGSLRKMTHPLTGTGLAYDLYKNAGRTERFGGDYGNYGGTPLVLSGGSILELLSNKIYTVPIYGRIPAGQGNVVPQPWTDYMSVFTATQPGGYATIRTCTIILFCSTATQVFTLTAWARVPNDCRVAASDMDFGTHGTLTQPVTATSVVDVTCTVGSSFNVGLGYGIGGTDVNGRRMRSTQGHQIRYQLYKDAARSQPWGLPADGMSFVDTGTGSRRGLTVYGTVPAQTTPRPGAYSDTVTVTVTY